MLKTRFFKLRVRSLDLPFVKTHNEVLSISKKFLYTTSKLTKYQPSRSSKVKIYICFSPETTALKHQEP